MKCEYFVYHKAALSSGDLFLPFQIIPIEGNFEVNDEKQKTFEEILPEIVISRFLHLIDLKIGWQKSYFYIILVY